MPNEQKLNAIKEFIESADKLRQKIRLQYEWYSFDRTDGTSQEVMEINEQLKNQAIELGIITTRVRTYEDEEFSHRVHLTNEAFREMNFLDVKENQRSNAVHHKVIEAGILFTTCYRKEGSN
ncbi:hypothetical protein A0U40_09680 [[Bacillus] sp. KCTC 13219]|nr:hypothetical protein A0U40_09680 [[Bacillus] sp. KCTC 13219]